MDSYYTRKSLHRHNILKGATLVFSQWAGYFDEKVLDFWKSCNVEIVKIHTSGHISPEDLERFVEAVSHGRIIPVHTLAPGRFIEMFGQKTVLLKNKLFLEI